MSDVAWCDRADTAAALIAVSAVFRSIGRILICLDADFRVVHASALLERFVGPETARELVGKPVTELLGDALFAPSGTLRQALEKGEAREGWRASMKTDHGSCLMSVTAA